MISKDQGLEICSLIETLSEIVSAKLSGSLYDFGEGHDIDILAVIDFPFELTENNLNSQMYIDFVQMLALKLSDMLECKELGNHVLHQQGIGGYDIREFVKETGFNLNDGFINGIGIYTVDEISIEVFFNFSSKLDPEDHMVFYRKQKGDN